MKRHRASFLFFFIVITAMMLSACGYTQHTAGSDSTKHSVNTKRQISPPKNDGGSKGKEQVGNRSGESKTSGAGSASKKSADRRQTKTATAGNGQNNAAVKKSDFPKPDHIVIVVEENHSYRDIVGSASAPYMNQLAKSGALFTNAHGVTHPSQPNYLALFSGSVQGVTNDSCLGTFKSDNLASALIKKKLTFAGYSEDMPKAGFTGCWHGLYGRKHNPWVDFSNVPAQSNLPMSDFPKDYSKLPVVSFVIPNVKDDMHNGNVKLADSWLKSHLGSYVEWAKDHNSLLIVTWDEDDFSKANHIATLFVGPMVKKGKYTQRINHYNVLRTIEEMYRLPYLGHTSKADPLRDVWKKSK